MRFMATYMVPSCFIFRPPVFLERPPAWLGGRSGASCRRPPGVPLFASLPRLDRRQLLSRRRPGSSRRRLRERPRARSAAAQRTAARRARAASGAPRSRTRGRRRSSPQHESSAAPSGAIRRTTGGSNTLSETNPIRRGISSSRTESRALRVRSRRVISSRHDAHAAMCARMPRRSSRLGSPKM